MSWKATAWAVKQTTGSTRRKALLLAIANYADEFGVCWPSQERLASDAEMSVDSIQRHSKGLEEQGLLSRTLMPKSRGHFSSYLYQLKMSSAPIWPQPQYLRPGRAAKPLSAAPQSLRYKPSKNRFLEPSGPPSTVTSRKPAEAFERSLQRQREPIEVIQHRIARRVGSDGWIVLGNMNDDQRTRLTNLERQGKLDDTTLGMEVLSARSKS